MAQNDFTEDKATLFGAGMVTVGIYMKINIPFHWDLW